MTMIDDTKGQIHGNKQKNVSFLKTELTLIKGKSISYNTIYYKPGALQSRKAIQGTKNTLFLQLLF